MRPAYAHLTEHNYLAVVGKPPTRTVRGFAIEQDGRPLVVAGFYPEEDRQVLFATFTDELRSKLETVWGRRVVAMGARKIREMVEASPLPVESFANHKHAKAERILTHMGFQHVGGSVYRHDSMRSKVLRAEAIMRARGDPVEIPVTHHWANKGQACGVYGREIAIPAGSIVTGKTHKTEQINVLLSGTIHVLVGERVEKMTGPRVVVSPVGTKRIAFAETDVRWLTVHATSETDLEVIERRFIEPDVKQLEAA